MGIESLVLKKDDDAAADLDGNGIIDELEEVEEVMFELRSLFFVLFQFRSLLLVEYGEASTGSHLARVVRQMEVGVEELRVQWPHFLTTAPPTTT